MSNKRTRFLLEAEIQHQLKLSNENTAHFDYKILFDQGKISLDVYSSVIK